MPARKQQSRAGSANELTNVSQVLIMSFVLEPKPQLPLPTPLPGSGPHVHLGTPPPERSDERRAGRASESSPILLAWEKLLASAVRQCVVHSRSLGR